MKRLLLAIALLSPFVSAQSTTINPDCDIPFTFTATGRSSLTGCGQNKQGVTFWHLTYSAVGFSALSLVVQTAPDTSGTPGSWSTFTAASGTNPATSITGVLADATFSGYSPWASVDLSSVTGSGTVTGHLYGCRTPGCGGGASSGGGGGSGCAGTTGTPCVIAGVNSGSAVEVQVDPQGGIKTGACPNTAAIALSSSGLTQIVALTSGKSIKVCHISIGFASGVNFQLESGTGSNCGSSTAAVTGTYQAIAGIALDEPFILTASQALCGNLGTSVTGGGLITYDLQ
jgi:hypothetical protein